MYKVKIIQIKMLSSLICVIICLIPNVKSSIDPYENDMSIVSYSTMKTIFKFSANLRMQSLFFIVILLISFSFVGVVF